MKVQFTIEADISDLPMLNNGMGKDFNVKTYIKMALANYRLHAINNLKTTSKHDALQLKELYNQQLTLGQRLSDSIK